MQISFMKIKQIFLLQEFEIHNYFKDTFFKAMKNKVMRKVKKASFVVLKLEN